MRFQKRLHLRAIVPSNFGNMHSQKGKFLLTAQEINKITLFQKFIKTILVSCKRKGPNLVKTLLDRQHSAINYSPFGKSASFWMLTILSKKRKKRYYLKRSWPQRYSKEPWFSNERQMRIPKAFLKPSNKSHWPENSNKFGLF